MTELDHLDDQSKHRFSSPIESAESFSEIDLLRAELSDDPNLTVYQLTPEEQAKIHIKVVACEHTKEYGGAIVNAIGRVQYFVAEDVVVGSRKDADSGFERDLRINSMGKGIMSPDEDPVKLHTVMASYMASEFYISGNERPVIRTMDVPDKDEFPIREDPELLRLFGGRDRDIDEGMVRVQQRELLMNIMDGTVRQRLDTNRAAIRDFIELTSLDYRVRDQRQIDDLAVIAANAVRRHPERDEITFGVMQGASHEHVLSSLVDGTAIRADELIRIPPNIGYEGASPLWKSIRASALSGELPSSEAVDRALFGEYLRMLTTRRYGYKESGVANRIIHTRLEEVTDAEISVFLAGVDKSVATSDPDDFAWQQNFRTQEIPRRLLGIVGLRDAIEEADHKMGHS